MAISKEALQAILKELPEPQRVGAMKRILLADSVGWTHIGVWTWFITRRDEADICGINPKGRFDFVYWQEVARERI